MNRRQLSSLVIATCLAMPLSGCGSDDDRPKPKPSGPTARFVTDELPAGITVSLREASVDEDALVLDIVQQGAGPVYGLAFRLETDAEILELASVLPSDAFSGAVTRAVEPRPGLTVGVVTKRGEESGVDTPVIGTVRLSRTSSAGARVTFVPSRSRLFDDRGQPIPDVSFVGGTLELP